MESEDLHGLSLCDLGQVVPPTSLMRGLREHRSHRWLPPESRQREDSRTLEKRMGSSISDGSKPRRVDLGARSLASPHSMPVSFPLQSA